MRIKILTFSIKYYDQIFRFTEGYDVESHDDNVKKIILPSF